ncbi:MAG: hypothetical protein GX592_08405 [Clostridiales bacterium]|nr:hypothetical protein [Clostridiales bacterium]
MNDMKKAVATAPGFDRKGIIPAPGKLVGDGVGFGGLFGRAPVTAAHPFSSRAFIARGRRIPTPLNSPKN